MKTLFLVATFWTGAAFASNPNCMSNCDKIPEVCSKACQSKGGANSGMCKAKCDDAAKKCKEQCEKKDQNGQ